MLLPRRQVQRQWPASPRLISPAGARYGEWYVLVCPACFSLCGTSACERAETRVIRAPVFLMATLEGGFSVKQVGAGLRNGTSVLS